MNTDEARIYECIGRAIMYAGAIESKINCVLAFEYTKNNTTENENFTKEILENNMLTLRNKIELLIDITKRHELSLNITKAEFQRFLSLRNKLAHCTVQYDLKTLKIRMRDKFENVADIEKEVNELGWKICCELERAFSDILWGNFE